MEHAAFILSAFVARCTARHTRSCDTRNCSPSSGVLAILVALDILRQLCAAVHHSDLRHVRVYVHACLVVYRARVYIYMYLLKIKIHTRTHICINICMYVFLHIYRHMPCLLLSSNQRSHTVIRTRMMASVSCLPGCPRTGPKKGEAR